MTRYNLEIIQDENSRFILEKQSRRTTKYLPWSYSSIELAQAVQLKILQRWDDCPLQELEDYVTSFVPDKSSINPTNIAQDSLQSSWVNNEYQKVDLVQVSGSMT